MTANPGADLLGWSALPLLAASPETGPWLFVTGKEEARLSRGPLTDADFTAVPGDYTSAWTLPAGAVAGVVIDGDALAHGTDSAALNGILDEAIRVSGSGERVFVVCGDRRIPRRLRDWRDYGRQSGAAWRRSAARRGEAAEIASFARLDGDRLTGLTLADGAADAAPREADRVVLRMTNAEMADTVIRGIVRETSRNIGIDLQVDHIAVRKIGKTATFLTGPDRRRYILRIARSPIAHTRAQRNFAALDALGRPSVDPLLRGRVPAAVYRATHGGYPYFVETCLDGRPGPLSAGVHANAHGWATDAVTFITALHRATAECVAMNGGALSRLVLEPIARLTDACQGIPGAARVLAQVAAQCGTALRARTLPLVQTHGDFTESNCLFDADGRLTAVVDWEVSERCGLPLLDLLQLMPIRDEKSQHPRWQRFDAWLDLWRAPERLMTDPVVGPYARTLGLDLEVVPPLILAQWVTHVADRVHARREDDRWMRLRVRQPLESLERIVCD